VRTRGGQPQPAPLASVGGGQEHKCHVCYDDANFHLTCCKEGPHACAFCLRELVRELHAGDDPVCRALTPGCLVPLTHPHTWPLGDSITKEAYEHTVQFPPWYYAESARKDGKVHLFYYNLQDLEEGRDPRVLEIIHLVYPKDGLSGPMHSAVYKTRRPFAEL
jgi:hypothetical protein